MKAMDFYRLVRFLMSALVILAALFVQNQPNRDEEADA